MVRISAIYEKDNKTPKESHQFRVGREGSIFHLSEGRPMILEYSNTGGYLHTSTVEQIDEDDNGLWITTRNTVYVLDKI